jgi:hypothetical protein
LRASIRRSRTSASPTSRESQRSVPIQHARSYLGLQRERVRQIYLTERNTLDVKTVYHFTRRFDVYLDVVNLLNESDRQAEFNGGRPQTIGYMTRQMRSELTARLVISSCSVSSFLQFRGHIAALLLREARRGSLYPCRCRAVADFLEFEPAGSCRPLGFRRLPRCYCGGAPLLYGARRHWDDGCVTKR